MTETLHWLREGLRAAFLLQPRTAGVQARPRDVLTIVLLVMAFQLAMGWLQVAGPADFSLRGRLLSWWSLGVSVALVWALLWRRDGEDASGGGVAAWFTLWLVAAVVPSLLMVALGVAFNRELLPESLSESAVFGWSSFLLVWAWLLAIVVRLGAHVGLRRERLAALGVGMAAIFGVSAWQFPDSSWERSYEDYVPPPRMSLSEESFEAQQALFQRSVAALVPERPGVADVYGLVFAPYAREDVFLRESRLVADLLVQRFDAEGRVLQLVNNVQTADSLPWATPRNLKRALHAIAGRMDREKDLLWST